MIDKDLYMEATGFLLKSKGSYTFVDSDTYKDIIKAMLDSRYRIIRDQSGKIASFTTWWMIHESDVELVRDGGKPGDLNGGSIVYVADHAGTGAIPELVKFIKSTIGIKGVCWHHRYKQPKAFRYFPEKKGDRYEV